MRSIILSKLALTLVIFTSTLFGSMCVAQHSASYDVEASLPAASILASGQVGQNCRYRTEQPLERAAETNGAFGQIV